MDPKTIVSSEDIARLIQYYKNSGYYKVSRDKGGLYAAKRPHGPKGLLLDVEQMRRAAIALRDQN